MKILVAANFFKGSLSAIETSEIIKNSILEVDNSIKVETLPIADGGDGTLDVIMYYTKCKEEHIEVTGPIGIKVKAKWLVLNKKTAVIEGAQANGLSLLTPDEYNPLVTTSYGIGELIKNALDHECKKIFVTIGGSSTNDGGIGILQALGAKFLDIKGQELGFGGGGLDKLASINLSGLDKRLKKTKIIAACDVENPLCGQNGASFVYASQKGASIEKIKLLDSNLKNFADITEKTLNRDYKNYPGAGAAGGIGFALKAFLSAELIPGFQLITELSGIEEKLKNCDLVITTEGKLDSQTLQGKAPYQIVKMAQKYNMPAIILAGAIERNFNIQKAGITAAFSITDGPISLKNSINNAPSLLANITKQVINVIILKKFY